MVASTAAPAQGADAVIETVADRNDGNLHDRRLAMPNGNIGQYSIQATLNAFVKTGTSNDTIATAQDLTGTLLRARLERCRSAGGGRQPARQCRQHGRCLRIVPVLWLLLRRTGRPRSSESTPHGQIVQVIPVPEDTVDSLSGVELDPVNNMLYAAVTTSFNGYGGPGSGSVDGELLEFNPITGQLVATIPLPADNSNYYYYYPYGFSIASDGNFWIAAAQQRQHHPAGCRATTRSPATPPADYMPESASIGTDGNVYFSTTIGDVYQLNPTTGAVNYFASTASPFGTLTNTAPGGAGIWAADYYRWRSPLRLQRQPPTASRLLRHEPGPDRSERQRLGCQLQLLRPVQVRPVRQRAVATFVPGPIGLTIWGVDNPNPPAQDTQDYYSFCLDPGPDGHGRGREPQRRAAQISIVDGNGDVLATGVSGATNVSESIEDFVAPSTGTYYVEVTGDPGVQYSVVVTRGADFTLQPHNSLDTAQNLTGTNGVLGYLAPPSAPLYILDDQLYGCLQSDLPDRSGDRRLHRSGDRRPGSPLNNPFGLNMAYDGTYLYYNDGADFGNNDDLQDRSRPPARSSPGQPGARSADCFTGLAYLNGEPLRVDDSGDRSTRSTPARSRSSAHSRPASRTIR